MYYQSNQRPQQFPAEISFPANFNDFGNSIGGKLIITPEYLVFRPHKLNFGDKSERVFELRTVSGYKKGFLTLLYIYFNNGHRICLTVWKKQQVIEEIEARKSAMGL